MRDIASVRQPLLGRPYRRLACPDFACRSAVSGARSRAAKTEKAAWKALKASTPPEQLAAAGT